LKPRSKKLRSPLKWWGGKAYLARRIVSCFPEHETYVEPYAGGLNVLLNKPPCQVEIVNDIDPGLAMFWSVMAGYRCDSRHFWEMRDRLHFNKYTRETFAMAKLHIDHPPWPIEVIDRATHAAFFLMKNRMSRGGQGKEFGWSERLRNGKPGDLNAWETTLESLQEVANRMRHVAVGNRAALGLIRHEWDWRTVLYLDPPYLHETRVTKDAYRHEMTADDHAELLGALDETSATFFLSGYRSGLYDEAGLIHGWHRAEFDMPNHSSQTKTKQRRTEVLWSNRPFPGSVPCAASEAVA
jgi:DNA adenine methylase